MGFFIGGMLPGKKEMDGGELKILQILDAVVRQGFVNAMIDSVVARVEKKLVQRSGDLLAWEPVPLVAYGAGLPDMLQSSWVFILRAGANTGPERHPNSHQRMMSYRGSGDLQIWADEKWRSNLLSSDPDMPIERRWVSIPSNMWHQAIVPRDNWVVVSFHTVPEDELTEERPDATNTQLIRQRRYLGG